MSKDLGKLINELTEWMSEDKLLRALHKVPTDDRIYYLQTLRSTFLESHYEVPDAQYWLGELIQEEDPEMEYTGLMYYDYENGCMCALIIDKKKREEWHEDNNYTRE